MDETEEQLNRDFNYNMVLAKSGIPNFLPLHDDRRLATAWLRKLSTSDTSIEELRVRNVFAYYLVLAIQDGQLGSPFTTEPPDAPLVSLHHLLPGDAYESDNESPREATEESESMEQRPGLGTSNAMDQSLLYEHSPDGGAFLAAQPVPRCGAFCYLAVVARQDQ